MLLLLLLNRQQKITLQVEDIVGKVDENPVLPRNGELLYFVHISQC